MRHFRRHADALTERRVRMNRLADVDGIRTHLNRQRNLANHVARMRADHATAQDFAVAVGFGAVVQQQALMADWLLLACPLTDQTRRLVDSKALALMPQGAGLINVARGEVVVEKDVIDALRTGHLGSAYLDVFEHEPLSTESPLWAMNNVIVTQYFAQCADMHLQVVFLND